MGARSATAGVTGTADTALQRGKCMLHPGLADLFEPLIIRSATAHPIEILRDDRMVGLRQRKPVEWLVAVITSSCSHPQPNKMIYSVVPVLCPLWQVAHNDIGAGHQSWRLRTHTISQGRHGHRFEFAVNEPVDLDRLHRRAYGNLSNCRADVCRSAKGLREFFRDQHSSVSDAEQLCVCVVVVLVPFDIEKREAGLAVAD